MKVSRGVVNGERLWRQRLAGLVRRGLGLGLFACDKELRRPGSSGVGNHFGWGPGRGDVVGEDVGDYEDVVGVVDVADVYLVVSCWWYTGRSRYLARLSQLLRWLEPLCRLRSDR